MKGSVRVTSMKKYASFDFHLHSWWSYDACAPVEYYFQRAKELGLHAFAVTDHNNNDALGEIRKVAQHYPEVGFVSGAELTACTPYGQLDLVCLGLPLEPTAEFVQLQKEYRAYNQNMGDAISLLVEKMGHSYTREERKKLLEQYRPGFTLELQGITHVRNEIQAEYMVKKSVVKTRAEFYSYLWGENRIRGGLTYAGMEKVSSIPCHQFVIRMETDSLKNYDFRLKVTFCMGKESPVPLKMKREAQEILSRLLDGNDPFSGGSRVELHSTDRTGQWLIPVRKGDAEKLWRKPLPGKSVVPQGQWRTLLH